MNRRDWIKRAGGAGAYGVLSATGWSSANPAEIAFTFDDPTTNGAPGMTWKQLNDRMLAALQKHKVKATLFVCGKRVDSADGKELIHAWDRAGHGIANHTFSHLYFNQSSGSEAVKLEQFAADALKVEPLIRDYPQFQKLFRYPYLKEGDTIEKRDGMRKLLQEHGYRIGRVTIDASDWAISARLEARLKKDQQVDTAAYRDFYLAHIWQRAEYYDSLAKRVLGRPVRHTVLLHHNVLSALYLDDLIGMFARKGWKPIDAEVAYRDPVYDLQPKILPAGESLIWALAKESGKFEGELRYPGEDDVYENPKMEALGL